MIEWSHNLKVMKFSTLIIQVDDLIVALDNERTKFAALDKKQKKFDQNLAEEKAISER